MRGADLSDLEALAWQIELGADEAIGDAPVNRFEEAKATETPVTEAPAMESKPAAPRGSDVSATTASGAPPGPDADPHRGIAEAGSLEDLSEMLKAWDGTPLKEGARNFVFSDGLPGAHLMVVGEAPGAEEDRQGKPFVGRAGQLLDQMLAAIGLSRSETDPAKAAYITNILPWRPPGNRTPSEQEAGMFVPFVERHIQLAGPRVILTMGNTPTKALLKTTTGIKRMRGNWVRHEATALPLIPTFHPAYLLRQPADKRLSWFDLIAVKKALDGEEPQIGTPP
ncbi:MAG: uracil-DNA glycosylase [Pseudomonadota bacterium]